jgi:hypothetical protein
MRHRCMLTMIAVAALCSAPALAYEWTEHIPLYQGQWASGGWYPDVQVDSAGNAHFSTASGSYGEVYYMLNDASTTLELVGYSATMNEFTSIGLMPDESPVIVYYDANSGENNCKYCVRNGPDDWTVTTIPHAAGQNYGDGCRMEVGSNGVVHVVWINYNTAKMEYARYESGAWTIESIASYAGSFPWPDIVVLPNGEPAVCYTEQVAVETDPGTVWLAVRGVGGGWTTEVAAADCRSGGWDSVAMTANDAGDIFIAYPNLDTGLATIAKKPAGGRGWEYEGTRAYNQTPQMVDIALDRNGEPVLAITRLWAKYQPEDKFGFGYVAKRGGHWVLEQIMLETRALNVAGMCMDASPNSDDIWAGMYAEEPNNPGVECLSIDHGSVKTIGTPPDYFLPRWDWFSIPEYPAGSSNPNDLFGDAMENRIFAYDPVAKTFILFSDDFDRLDPGMGYMLFMDVGETFDIAYDAVGLGRGVDIPEEGRALIGCPVIPGAGSLPQGELSIYNKTLDESRKVSEDDANPDPWLNANWVYWDQTGQTAKICYYGGGDATAVEPWRAYWVWAFHKDLVIYFDDEY